MIPNWQSAFHRSPTRALEIERSLDKIKNLKSSESRVWAKKLVSYYLQAWNLKSQSAELDLLGFADALSSAFDLFLVLDDIHQQLSLRKSGAVGPRALVAQEVIDLEDLHFRVNHELINLDSRMARLLNSVAANDPLVLTENLSSLKQSTEEVHDLLETLKKSDLDDFSSTNSSMGSRIDARTA